MSAQTVVGAYGKNSIKTDDNLTLLSNQTYPGETQLVVVTGNDDSPGNPITITLPDNPQLGDQIKIVAAGVAVTVDPNGNNLATTSISLASSLTFTFTRPLDSDGDVDCGTPGTWIAH